MKKYHWIVLLLMPLMLSNCIVSKKKYDALGMEKAALARQLGKTQASLDSAFAVIEDLQEQLASTKNDSAQIMQRLEKAMEQLESMTKNYNQLRANSSDEIKKLISRLELAQADLSGAQNSLEEREQKLRELEQLLDARNQKLQALKNQLETALLGFTKKGLSVEVKDGKVYVSLTDKLLFASGSIKIDERGKEALTELAKVLNEQVDLSIMVEGHTDDVPVTSLGDIKDNWDLSVMRATSVTRFLTETQKVDSKRITASGRGQFAPLVNEKTTEARSRNRRIEIVLIPQLDQLYNLIDSN